VTLKTVKINMANPRMKISMANQKLRINFSEEDLQDLQNGETFDWTFTTDKGEDIDIHLYNGEDVEDNNDGNDCEKCGNPEIMYWCNECEANTEEIDCPACGLVLQVDKKYHLNCN